MLIVDFVKINVTFIFDHFGKVIAAFIYFIDVFMYVHSFCAN